MTQFSPDQKKLLADFSDLVFKSYRNMRLGLLLTKLARERGFGDVYHVSPDKTIVGRVKLELEQIMGDFRRTGKEQSNQMDLLEQQATVLGLSNESLRAVEQKALRKAGKPFSKAETERLWASWKFLAVWSAEQRDPRKLRDRLLKTIAETESNRSARILFDAHQRLYGKKEETKPTPRKIPRRKLP